MTKPSYATLQAALANLEYNKHYKKLSPKRKKLLQRMAQAHVNPDAQQPDVVVRTMRRERKQAVMTAAQSVRGILDNVGVRARERLGVA